MSLETLLEAAEFLELTSGASPSARVSPKGQESYRQCLANTTEFHPYAKPHTFLGKSTEVISKTCHETDKSTTDDEWRDKRRAGGAGTREVHNKLEKNRRAHLKECFDVLKSQVPTLDDKKVSNLTILRQALRHIKSLKKKDVLYEKEIQQLSELKQSNQERVNNLMLKLKQMNVTIDLSHWMSSQDAHSHSTSTATEVGDNRLLSDLDDDDTDDIDTDSDIDVELSEKISPGAKLNHPSSNATMTTTVTMASSAVIKQVTAAKPRVAVTITPPSPPPFASATSIMRPPVTQILQQTLAQRALKQQQMVQAPVLKVVGAAPAVKFTTSTFMTRPKIEIQGQVVKKITQVHPAVAVPSSGQVTTASHITLVNKVLHQAIRAPIQTVNRNIGTNNVQSLKVVTIGNTSNQQMSLVGQPRTVPIASQGILAASASQQSNHFRPGTTQLNTVNLNLIAPGVTSLPQAQLIAPINHVAALQVLAQTSQAATPMIQGLELKSITNQGQLLTNQSISFLPTVSHVSAKVSSAVSHSVSNTTAAVTALLSAAGAIQPVVTTVQPVTVVSPVTQLVTPIQMTTAQILHQHILRNQQLNQNAGGVQMLSRVVKPTTLVGQPKPQLIAPVTLSAISKPNFGTLMPTVSASSNLKQETNTGSKVVAVTTQQSIS